RRFLPALGLVALLPAVARADAAGDEFFEKNVRPVLAEKCVGCHGPEKAKGGLRLDTREWVLKGGDHGDVVVPGKPKESRLVKAVRYADADLQMPPKGKLPDREVAALEKWVELGVPWPAKAAISDPSAIEKAAANHWAFRPVRRPAVP